MTSPTCTHRPRRSDKDAGYEHCMFCTETGDCSGTKGYCRSHGVVWSVWEEQAADAAVHADPAPMERVHEAPYFVDFGSEVDPDGNMDAGQYDDAWREQDAEAAYNEARRFPSGSDDYEAF